MKALLWVLLGLLGTFVVLLYASLIDARIRRIKDMPKWFEWIGLPLFLAWLLCGLVVVVCLCVRGAHGLEFP